MPCISRNSMKRSRRAGTIFVIVAEAAKKNLWANEPSTEPSGVDLKIITANQYLHLGPDKVRTNHCFHNFTHKKKPQHQNPSGS